MAVAVGQDLGLDVVRLRDVALQVDLRVAEVGRRLAGRTLQRLGQVLLPLDQAHPLAAAAERRLDDQGEADPGGLVHGLGGRHRTVRAGDHRRPGRHGRPAGLGLVAQPGHRLRGRSDERQAGLGHRSGEPGVLGQEPVARVDHRGPAAVGDLDDPGDVQVRLGRGGRSQQVGVVGDLDVERAAVGLRVHGHRGDVHLPARPQDPAGDLAPVGHQDARRCGHVAYPAQEFDVGPIAADGA